MCLRSLLCQVGADSWTHRQTDIGSGPLGERGGLTSVCVCFKQEVCLYSQKHFAPWRAGDPNSSFLVLKRLDLASRENPAPARPHPRWRGFPAAALEGVALCGLEAASLSSLSPSTPASHAAI